MMGLTRQQHRMLEFIKAFSREHGGQMPTRAQMGEHLGLRSKSGPQRIVDELVERGHLRRLPGHWAALELVDQTTAPLIDKPTLEIAVAYAATQQRPISEVIRDAVAEYRERHPL